MRRITRGFAVAALAGVGLAGWFPIEQKRSNQPGQDKGTAVDCYARFDAGAVAPLVSTSNVPMRVNNMRHLLVDIASIETSTVAMEVQGTTEDGVAPLTSEDQPVLIGGIDRSAGGNIVRDIAVASDGAVAITDSGDSITVDGTAGTPFEQGAGVVTAGTTRATIGTDDVVSTTLATAGAGAISATTQRVTIATNDPVSSTLAVVGSGATTANTQRVTQASDDLAVLSLDVVDDWDDGADHCEVVGVGGSATLGSVMALGTDGTPIQQGAGASTAGTLRVGIATDDVVSVALADDSIALEAGTATVGSIGAIVGELPAGTQNIGDVDVLTLPALVAGTATVGSVQIVNAQGNPVQVEIGDGTETALVTAAGELNVLATAQPGTDIGDVDVLSLPALVAGTATIGSIGAIVGALPTGTNNIGDVDVLTIPALVTGTATIGSVGVLPSAVATISTTTLAADWAARAADAGTLYFGIRLRETAGAAATFRVYAGVDATGELLDTIALGANQSSGERLNGDNCSSAAAGIFVQRVAGSAEAVVYYKDTTP